MIAALNDAAAGCDDVSDRQPDHVAGWQQEERLNQCLAEAAPAHEERAIVILKRARQCFRRARAPLVDQHHERKVAEVAIAFRDIGGVDIAFAAAGAKHDRVLGEKLAGDLDGICHDPARIGAQIQNDLLGMQTAQPLQRVVHLVGSAAQKVFEPQVAGDRVDQPDERHRANLEWIAFQRHTERVRLEAWSPLQPQAHLGPFFPGQAQLQRSHVDSRHGGVVHGHEAIARHDAAFGCRAARGDREHGGGVFDFLECDTHRHELAAFQGRAPLPFQSRVIRAVRIQ